jgi:Na+/proline symporter/CheY-like chemotaxis protein
MSMGFVIIVTALAYLGALFLVAYWGDRRRADEQALRKSQSWIYPLSLAVYCTSWTFFGSVGLASRNGFDFLAIYAGPMLLFAAFWPLILRVVRIAKAQNITSVADFIGARYGKSQAVAAMVCLIVTVGTIPYVALQLKAVSASLMTTIKPDEIVNVTHELPFFGDIALVVAMAMAAFAMLFGTRHADATEHQDGLILAVAAESIVKLVCFLAIGIYVTYVMFNGFGDLFSRVAARPDIMNAVIRWPDATTFFTMSVLSFCCGILLPRMFHVGVVENHSEVEVRRASWLFPAYLVLINLFVIPIAVAGMLTFPPGTMDSDMTVVALPLSRGNQIMTLAAFIGGLSAATAMVIVASVALSIMISNDMVIPALLNLRGRLPSAQGSADDRSDLGATILKIRRTIILGVLIAAYLYYRIAGEAQLASIGLLSFAAVTQLAPAFFGGLYWRRASARVAVLGMSAGLAIWTYTLLVPMLVTTGALPASLVTDGPLGIAWLKPQDLFGLTGLPPLAHGVFWSLLVNATLFVGISLMRRPTGIETMQANVFVPIEQSDYAPSFRLWRSAVTIDEVRGTVARYLGAERTTAAFESYAVERGLPLEGQAEADIDLLRYAERLLASAIGTASSRLVLSLLLKKRSVSTTDALKLLDDANAAMQYNREVLQTALEHARQGVSVFDADGKLMVWNRPFAEVLDLPPETLHIGVGFDRILRALAVRGEFGPGDIDALVTDRAHRLLAADEPQIERLARLGLVVEIRAAKLPDGGVVTTYTDVTASVAAAEELGRANETLERGEIGGRRGQPVEDALPGGREPRHPPAAECSPPLHDEPRRARQRGRREAADRECRCLARSGRGDPRRTARHFPPRRRRDEAGDRQLPHRRPVPAAGRGVHAARRAEGPEAHLRAVVPRGPFRPAAAQAPAAEPRLQRDQVYPQWRCAGRLPPARQASDAGGPGIPQNKQRIIFHEFQRLEAGAKIARGLGLGLSIVERIARVLEHKLSVKSKVGRGSSFSVAVPIAPALPAVTPGPAPAPIAAAPLDGLVVLAIDNEPKILEGMQALLRGWGCHTILAGGWREAHEALNESLVIPDVVIVDYHLDEGNGLDVVTQLRWRFGGTLPAILVTADRSQEVREKAQDRNVHLLNKPLKPAALRALLTQWRVQKQAAE